MYQHLIGAVSSKANSHIKYKNIVSISVVDAQTASSRNKKIYTESTKEGKNQKCLISKKVTFNQTDISPLFDNAHDSYSE